MTNEQAVNILKKGCCDHETEAICTDCTLGIIGLLQANIAQQSENKYTPVLQEAKPIC